MTNTEPRKRGTHAESMSIFGEVVRDLSVTKGRFPTQSEITAQASTKMGRPLSSGWLRNFAPTITAIHGLAKDFGVEEAVIVDGVVYVESCDSPAQIDVPMPQPRGLNRVNLSKLSTEALLAMISDVAKKL